MKLYYKDKVYLAVKDETLVSKALLRCLKNNHKDEYRQHMIVNIVTGMDTFGTTDGPATFVGGMFEHGGFVYFMKNELTKKQLRELERIEKPFGLIFKSNSGLETKCVNKIDMKKMKPFRRMSIATAGGPLF